MGNWSAWGFYQRPGLWRVIEFGEEIWVCAEVSLDRLLQIKNYGSNQMLDNPTPQNPFRQLTLLTNHQHPTEKSKESVHQCSDNKAQHLRIELQFGIDRSNICSLSSVLRWGSLINEKCKCKGNFFILFMLWNTWKHFCSFSYTLKKIAHWLNMI